MNSTLFEAVAGNEFPIAKPATGKCRGGRQYNFDKRAVRRAFAASFINPDQEGIKKLNPPLLNDKNPKPRPATPVIHPEEAIA